ncbi:PH domain-containing protein [Arthrobacter cryoconiti]|uniref:PH domain-containing protein n=1 Tax=Arthrobacter cryoconiti TaxID=748907 RepID=A0ABV8R2D7_9MICC|nr:PH domain-containing protein [Arthrobacter cryoconiti]MCC9069964.1 PH domain-containing protein [Arthrobacter cryoconiti]
MMAKIEKLIAQARLHLQAGEQVSAAVMGSYETKVLGTDSVRSGVMLATDQRVIFYAKKLGGYDLESFTYGNIFSFEQSKTTMGYQVSFCASGNKVTLKWIVERTGFEKFVEVFKSRIGQPALESVASPTPVPAAPVASLSDAVFDQLRQLGQLRDAGIVTTAEFEAKKTELLSRL